MKPKGSTFLILLCSLLIHGELRAQTGASLHLRAFVPPFIKTNVRESRLNSTQTLWLLTSQTNSQYPLEGQKFEVVGLDQSEMEARIKKIVGKDQIIQHEILISHLKSSMKNDKIIFLKISAN